MTTPRRMHRRYCAGCAAYEGPHCHCGVCDGVCDRRANDWSVVYQCPSCQSTDITLPECDAYERAEVDKALDVPERHKHPHARMDD